MGDGDPITPQGLGEPARGSQVEMPVGAEILDADTGTGHLSGEPTLSAGGQNRQVLAPRSLQADCEVREHPLRPPRSIGFDEMRNPQTSDRLEPLTHLYRRGRG